MGFVAPTRIARPELLDVVAVQSIVLPLDAEPSAPVPPWILLDRIMRYGLYSNPAALPRAYMVTRARAVDDEQQALETLLTRGFDRHREAVLIGGRRDPDVAALADGPATLFRPARIVADAPERVVVEASAERPSLLVLADAFAPGWSALVDGRPVQLWQSNYYVRGVLLPPGTHRVEFDYRAPGFATGMVMAGAAASIAFVFAVAARFRRRALQRPPNVDGSDGTRPGHHKWPRRRHH
jgi:hypothetical protein